MIGMMEFEKSDLASFLILIVYFYKASMDIIVGIVAYIAF